MKLTVRPRFGFQQVRGGKVVKVATEHAVPLSGRTSDPDQPALPPGDEKFAAIANPLEAEEGAAWALPGDLAVEIVDLKTGQVIGHSYLTGPAICTNRYTPAAPYWFEPARHARATDLERHLVSTPAQASAEYIQEFRVRLIELVQAIRRGPLDVVTMDVALGEPYQDAAQVIGNAWKYAPFTRPGEPQPTPDADLTCHLIATIWRRPPGGFTFRKKGHAHVNLHMQPARHANAHAATSFQVALLLSIPSEPAQ